MNGAIVGYRILIAAACILVGGLGIIGLLRGHEAETVSARSGRALAQSAGLCMLLVMAGFAALVGPWR